MMPSWFYVAIGVVVGTTLGWAMHAYVARAIEAENRRLRIALRNIRWGHAGEGQALRRYIDWLLGDGAA